MTKAIGIDLGGTHIKAVLLDGDGQVLHKLQHPTNDSNEEGWKKAIVTILHNMQRFANDDHLPVGLSAPGLANAANDRILFMPGRLQGIENFMWTEHLQHKTWVLNDAHAALVAEAHHGAGKGCKDVLLLTLGTGVGGGVFLNGQLHQGLLCRAGHVGHMSVNADSDIQDITGMPGSLEDVIGNATLQQRSFGRYTTTHQLVKDYQNGDMLATYVWLHSVKKLAVALASFINILSPQVIILGGGIAEAGNALFEPLKEFMRLFEWPQSRPATPVVPALFDEYSGAVGAGLFALQKNSES